MWTDPIVEETRAIRAEIAARFSFDIWALGDYFKGKCAEDAVTLINQCHVTDSLAVKSHAVETRYGTKSRETVN